MREWRVPLAGVLLIVGGYAADRLVGAYLDESRRELTMGSAIWLESLVRIAAAAALLWFGLMVLRAPGPRLGGLIMAIVGGYFALVPALLVSNLGPVIPLFVLDAYDSNPGLLPWLSAGVAVLGIVELLRTGKPAGSGLDTAAPPA